MSSTNKNFTPSSWAVDNRVTVYIVTFIIVLFGMMAYITMPREDFPEVIENKVFITSVFPGNAAEDVEKLVTDPLEKRIKNISGASKVTSNSFQDYSMIIAEFDDKYSIDQAKLKVKDEIDQVKAAMDWPKQDNGAKVEPTVFAINIAEEVPILNINIKGDYPSQKIKEYAKIIKDEIENVSEVKKVEVLGVGDKEVEIALDMFKMSASKVSFDDIARAIQGENMTISGGNIQSSGMQSNIRVIGEFNSVDEINQVVVKSFLGSVLLRDIADVKLKEKEKSTYARESGEDVVMIVVKKRSGTNMIHAIEKIKEKVSHVQKTEIPTDVTLEYTGDMSNKVEHAVDELSNHIIFGVILVMIVLMFTMGLKNSLFVGSAIPLSMLMAFAILDSLGITLNTMVLFALVMGLGMLVDDGIVVVDNVYANLQKGYDRIKASKIGIGEIAWPVISSTATTLAAFAPLAMWPGTMGKFMIIFPATLFMELCASLFVAMIINASMTGGFMSKEDKNIEDKTLRKATLILSVIGLFLLSIGIFKPSSLARGLGHLSLVILGFMWVYNRYIFKRTQKFQHELFPRFESWYAGKLNWLLDSSQKESFRLFFQDKLTVRLSRARVSMIAIFALLFLSFTLIGVFPPKTNFFPENVPNQNFVFIEYPQGTPIEKTNQTTLEVEKIVTKVIQKYIAKANERTWIEKIQESIGFKKDSVRLIQSIVAQVGEGAGNPNTDVGMQKEMPHKGKVFVLYEEMKKRNGINTQDILNEIRKTVPQFPGAKITVEKERNGPPAGGDISIELYSENYEALLKEGEKIIQFINGKNISGIEKLSLDVNKEKPEMKMTINRTLAGNLSTSTGQVGFTLRRAIFGQEISTYKDGDDDYKIVMRLEDSQRKNESLVLNQPVTFRNMNNGQLVQIPISTLASTEPSFSLNQIKHKNGKRFMTISSNVLNGFNKATVNASIAECLKTYNLPENIEFKFSGEQEEQAKNQNFLNKALLLCIFGITLIIVLQFNSTSKTVIIMTTVLLSFSGVFFGLVFFRMNFIVIMTMMGIISLAGVVVKNGIVLMDFFVLLLDKKKEDLGVETHEDLPMNVVIQCIVEAGQSRLRPVLLTATTAILGLIPLAIGLNFNFFTFLTDFNPHIYVGGDNVMFWGPLAWTIIFGLSYATILTLVMVPVMFYGVSKWKRNRRLNQLEKLR